jgi:IS30 family transposase
MKTKRRTWLSPSERIRLWELWKEGQRATDIAALLEVKAHTIAVHLSRAGGIAPVLRRGPKALTEAEREEISRLLASHCGIREIARRLNRSPSTISREVERNYGRTQYRARSAEQRAWKCARRPKSCKLAQSRRLRDAVAAKLADDWSPQQISGWLGRKFARQPLMHVSHETIYRTLYVQARGALKHELTKHLRTGRARRRPQRASTNDTQSIVNGVSISERPAEVADRAVPGHWEGDLLFGTVNSYIATLVERQTRYTMLVKVAAKETSIVTAAIQKQMGRLPEHLRKSLTWDRGSEMSGHQEFAVAANLPVFFCDPRSPWQRGSNENTNGLLRQYFPNGQDVSQYSQSELDRVARKLNGRPRKTLDYRTPAEAFNQLLR